MSPRRKLLIGTAILACCAFAGGAYAATSDTNPKQAFLSDVAKRLGVSPQRLRSALEGAFTDRLNADVKGGRLTPAEAKAIEERIHDHAGFGFPLFLAPRFGFRMIHGGPFSGPAFYIGISEQQLLDQLTHGKSLAQVATAHGKSVSGLENALVAAARTKFDRARAAGLITSAQEQRILSGLQARIGMIVNRTGFGPRFLFRPRLGFAPRFGPRPPFGPGGPPPGGPLRLPVPIPPA
jgi:AraC-like DNA-binding protein